MPPTHPVAVIQLHPIPVSPEANFNKASRFIRSAATQGAKLAVLPEYHLTSWVPDDPKFLSCCDQWEDYLEKYKELAKECKICIVPGTIVERHHELKDEEGRAALLNVAYFIDNEGEVKGKYVKKNLWYVAILISGRTGGSAELFLACSV
jgi:predicted amidohydrolase